MDNDQTSLLFEILITFYMEGVLDGHRLYEMLKINKVITDYTKKIDVSKITKENLLLCEPWLKSLGFILFVEEYKINEYNMDNSEYCKILLKDNPKDKNFFLSKNISKPYHFVLFANYKSTNKIENMKCLFYKPKDIFDSKDSDKIFTIKFKPLNVNTGCK